MGLSVNCVTYLDFWEWMLFGGVCAVRSGGDSPECDCCKLMQAVSLADSFGCGCCRCEAVRGGVSVGDGVRLLVPSCRRCVFRRWIATASTVGAQSFTIDATLLL